MIAAERKRYILEALNSRGCISLKEVAKALKVAEITIRRDFEKLEAEGKLKRVQGGAAALEELDGAELATPQKLSVNSREKSLVAEYAASLVKDGDCVFIDSGTTMYPLANLLIRKRIQIITNNTLLLNMIKKSTARIFLVGGEYVPNYNMSVGPFALEMLRQFYFDCAFLSCSGFDVTNQVVYSTEPESMVIKQTAMEIASKNYLLLDSSKFEKRGFLKLCDANRFDAILCNQCELNGQEADNMVFVSEDGLKEQK